MQNMVSLLPWLLVAVVVVDPADSFFSIKTPLFFLVMLISLFYFRNISLLKPPFLLILLFVSFIVPVYGVFVFFINDASGNPAHALAMLKAFLFFLIIIPLLLFDSKVDKMLAYTPLLIIPVTLSIYSLFIINAGFDPELYSSIIDSNNIKLAMRDVLGIKLVMIYYLTSPLLLFSVCFFSAKYVTSGGKWNIVFIGIIVFAMYLSGARANIVMAFVLPSLIILQARSKSLEHYFLKLVSLPIAIIVITLSVMMLSDSGEISNSIKSLHFSSIINNFTWWGDVVFGQGLGSEYYSYGKNEIIFMSELTYVEIFRQLGLFFGFLLIAVLMVPILTMLIKGMFFHWFNLAYIGYLVISATNPLLMNSTGMFVLAAALLFSMRSSSLSPPARHETGVLKVR